MAKTWGWILSLVIVLLILIVVVRSCQRTKEAALLQKNMDAAKEMTKN